MLSPKFRRPGVDARVLALMLSVVMGCSGPTDVTDETSVTPVGWLFTEATDPVTRRSRAMALDVSDGSVDTLSIAIPNVSYPVVSYDGRELVFTDAGDVILYDMTTGRLRDITYLSSNDYWPVWRPNGTQVLTRRGTSTGDHFVLVNTDRSGEQVILRLDDYGLVTQQTSWSPDGRWLYFAAVSTPTPFRLIRLDLSTPSVEPDTLGPVGITAVAVSHSSGRIAVLQHRGSNDSDTTVAGLLELSTGAVQVLGTYTLLPIGIAWSPDERFLAVSHFNAGGRGLDVDLIDVRTGRIVRTFRDFAVGAVPFSWGAVEPQVGQ